MAIWEEENLLRRVRESKNTDKVKKAYKNYARLSDQIENYRIKNCTFINGIGNTDYEDYIPFEPQYVRFIGSYVFDGYEDEMGISYDEILENYINFAENNDYFSQQIDCFYDDDYQKIKKVINQTKVFKNPIFEENSYGDYHIEFDIPTDPTDEEFKSIKNAFTKMFKNMR